ncbi:MAG: cytochrome c biogenesis protein ResB, partial [Muribaculaceae bacterium]|nr:cytochrome c biogenesis protein ResB [Muribaculaceae bacterium]
IFHLSFILMIAGGFLTSFMARRGNLHLKPDVAVSVFVDEDGISRRLPAEIRLVSFTPRYYRGMNVPQDFMSEVAVAGCDTMHISMNSIGILDNYRLHQKSYDNKGGSVLGVTHDPFGIATVYMGFVLFAIGGGWMLLKRLVRIRKARVIPVILMLASFSHNAFATPAVGNTEAESLAGRQVLFNGEIVTFNSVATRLTYKLTGRSEVGGLSPEAFVASLVRYRKEWSEVPFIKVKSPALRERLNIKGDYTSVRQLYNDTVYLPGLIYEGGSGVLDKDILSLDEKISLLAGLWGGTLFMPLQADQKARPEWIVRLEVAYNRIAPVRILFISSIVVTLLSLCVAISGRKIRLWPCVMAIGILGVTAYIWLWIISARFPLSTTSEMMEFLAVVSTILIACISRQYNSPLFVMLSMTAAAFLYLVSW